MLYNLARYEESISYYDKALTLNPDDVDTLNNKDNALDKLGKHEAMSDYDKALALNPDYISSEGSSASYQPKRPSLSMV